VPRSPRGRRKAQWKALKYNGDCNGAFWRTKRRNQNKEFSFPFFVGSSPDPSTERVVVRKNSLILVPSEARQRGAQISNAYAEVSHHHALRALQVAQSLRDCSKWVRAKVSNSSQNETSSRHNERAEGAREEESGKIPRRVATNWDGTGALKRADLSLFRI